MKTEITTETEGKQEITELNSMLDYLYNIADVSNDSQDFISKVAYGVTDETSGLSMEDSYTLEEWYYRTYLKL